MALAAGLAVVERAESVGDVLDFIKLGLIRCVRGIVHQPVGFVIKAGGRFGKGRREDVNSKSQRGNTEQELHEHLDGRAGPQSTLELEKSKAEINGHGFDFSRSVDKHS